MYRVFKFGGASIRNPSAIRQMGHIVSRFKDNDPLLIVVSAMGKTTNTLERILDHWWKGNTETYSSELGQLIERHNDILAELGLLNNVPAFGEYILQLKDILSDRPEEPYNYHYDQIVSFGELFSSSILAEYLRSTGIDTDWIDARELVHTNSDYREAQVDWEETMTAIRGKFQGKVNAAITQGFIGSCTNGTTTLGREGSDYTAAIFSCALEAQDVTIWKDVPGVMNADPRLISDAVLFRELPYHEAAEMTYYGAKVIHPKTIKPLENAGIALHVRPFEKPEEKGTVIHTCSPEKLTPAIIFKENLSLFSFKLPDFEFVNDTQLHHIFSTLKRLNINIYMMQNSAISVSVAMDNDEAKMKRLMEELKNDFDMFYNTGLKLITIKNYVPEMVDNYVNSEKVLLEQRTRHNFRALLRD
jgi:aspartate kinase